MTSNKFNSEMELIRNNPDLLKLLTPKLNKYIKMVPSEKQTAFLLLDCLEAFYGGAAAGGKISPLDSVIVTPFGLRKFGALRRGDVVCNPEGGNSKVIAIHPQGIVPFYKFTFSDGAVCETGLEHLWKYSIARKGKWRKSGKKWKIATTAQLIEMMKNGKDILIPLTEPVQFTKSYRYDMHPYVMGAFLGDGYIGNGLSFCNVDEEIINRVISLTGENWYHYGKDHHPRDNVKKELIRVFKLNKIFDKHAWDKFIPEQYKYGTIEDRFELLRGLMDTDGYCSEDGKAYYTSVSKQLAEDVQWLVRSLGGNATITSRIGAYRNENGEKIECREAYQVYIRMPDNADIFYVSRKKERAIKYQGGRCELKKRIVSIEYSRNTEGQCITVDDINGLYITNDFIVTHNSVALLAAALQYVDEPGYNALLLRDTFANLSKPEGLIDKSQEWLANTDAKWTETKKMWRFPSSATLSFGHLDGPKAHYQFLCVSSDHDVLTEHGWKNIADVQENELIATLDKDTRQFKFSPVRKKHEYDYDGKMIKTYGKCIVSFCVTPNHTIWGSSRKVNKLRPFRADSLPATICIPQWANWDGVCDKEYFEFISDGNNGKTVRFNKYDFSEFIGWFLSEGNTYHSNKKWKRNYIVISQNRGDNYNRIADIIERNFIHVYKGKRCVILYSKSLSIYLDYNCGVGSKNKKIPVEFKNWPVGMLRRMIWSLLQGDGHWYTKDQGVFVTASPKLKDDFCEIAIKSGYRVTVSEVKYDHAFDYKVPNGVKWNISIKDMHGKDTIVGNVKEREPKEIDYKGKVHCVTVDSGIFLIKHNGRCSWTGNSSAYQFIGIDESVQIPKNQALYLFSRLRRIKERAHIPIRFRCASNPPAPENIAVGAWVKDRYVDPRTKDPNVVFIPAKLDDNPAIDKEEYEKSLDKLSPVIRAQLRFGDWNIAVKGTLFDREWFMLSEMAPLDVVRRVRFWDMAGTEPNKKNRDPDYTASCRMSLDRAGQYHIEHICRFRKTPMAVEAQIRRISEIDGLSTEIFMEQESGSSGKAVIDHYTRNVLPGFIFRGVQLTGSKRLRAAPLSTQAQAGNIYLVKGRWIDEFLDEIEVFPEGDHDDMCFIAGIKIATLFGNKNIEDIKVGEYVITPDGISKVLESGCTGKKKVIENCGLIGTENHPIYQKNGTFADLKYADEKLIDKFSFKGLFEWRYLKILCSMGLHIDLWEENKGIISVNRTQMKVEEIQKDFMLLFGNIIREKKYLKAMKFITKIIIHLIMSLIIWNVYQLVSIGKNILLKIKKKWKNTLEIFGKKLMCGIGLQREDYGIENMEKNVWKKEKKRNLFAYIVERYLNQNIRIPSIVVGNAQSCIKNPLENINELKSVLYVDQNLQQCRENQKEKHVLINADGSLCQKQERKKMVYNLKTKASVYYANGVLVHNCDSTSGAFSQLAKSGIVPRIGWFG